MNVLLAIATNILMPGFVIQGHILQNKFFCVLQERTERSFGTTSG